MPRINKSLPLAALLAIGANAQLSTSSVIINPSDTAVTTVTFSTCPSSTASVTTITNPHTSTYTGAPRPGSGDVTTYVTVCPGFCTGGPSCTGGLAPTTHTITATCPCHQATSGGVGPGLTQTVAVCPTCGPGGSPVTATLITPIPGATGGVAPGPGPGVEPSPGAAVPGSSPSSGTSPGSPDTGSSGPGAGASPGGGAGLGAAGPGSSMPGMGSGSSTPDTGAGAGSGAKYGNGTDIPPSISKAAGSGAGYGGAATGTSGSYGAASRTTIFGGLLSAVGTLCVAFAFIL